MTTHIHSSDASTWLPAECAGLRRSALRSTDLPLLRPGSAQACQPADLCWDERGLILAVVQDAHTGAVLMVAWMNQEALRLTLETGETYFWSRSRGELWHKGATSGNIQRVVGLWADCDGDALLVQVEPAGPACHTGAVSCFYRPAWGKHEALPLQVDRPREPAMTDVLQMLWSTIEDRKRNPPPGSYTASLFAAGLPRIAQKVGEEAVETTVAALSQANDRVVAEMADLVYHCLVLLSARGLSWDAVEEELARRFK